MYYASSLAALIFKKGQETRLHCFYSSFSLIYLFVVVVMAAGMVTCSSASLHGCTIVLLQIHLLQLYLVNFELLPCLNIMQEFVIKTVLFTMSVLPDVSQPILIVTTPGSLSLWEDQFNKLAPFINVVVYDGGKDKLKLIQDLEFYESGSSIMLQVLLSHADAVLEVSANYYISPC
jgi:hypothetical protein